MVRDGRHLVVAIHSIYWEIRAGCKVRAIYEGPCLWQMVLDSFWRSFLFNNVSEAYHKGLALVWLLWAAGCSVLLPNFTFSLLNHKSQDYVLALVLELIVALPSTTL